MPRKPRLDPPGGWHHVMNRGLRRSPIFTDDADRQTFLEFTSLAVEAAGVELTSYCLMGNHFHLILHCPTAGLSLAMQRLSGRYTQWFNARHACDGPLFRGRFASVPIVSDAQLLAATRYVHRNPLELNFDLDDYPWSSYRNYLTDTAPRWLTTGFVLNLQGGPNEHRRFVEACQSVDEFHVGTAPKAVDGPTPPHLRPAA